MVITFLILIGLFFLGASIGSFISVLIYRLRHQIKGILRGRSQCPLCKKQLEARDLIPLFSFLTLRGKCRHCNKDISFMYPTLEIVTGFLFVAFYFLHPFIEPVTLYFSGKELALYALSSFYIFVLVFTFFYDLQYLEIADEILLPAIVIGLIATIGYPSTPHIIDALIGAGIGITFFVVQYVASKGKWIGFGDVRIGAFMGVILGWQMVIVALFLSYLIGTVVAIFIIARQRKMFGIRVPLAPFLVAGTIATMFYGEKLLQMYLAG